MVRQTNYAIAKAYHFVNFDNCSAVSLTNVCYSVYVHVSQELLLKLSNIKIIEGYSLFSAYI